MRTTLVLDDRLLRQARKRAVERGLTLSDLINEALRSMLATRVPGPVPHFRMIGERSTAAGHEPAGFAEALDDDDRAVRRL